MFVFLSLSKKCNLGIFSAGRSKIGMFEPLLVFVEFQNLELALKARKGFLSKMLGKLDALP